MFAADFNATKSYQQIDKCRLYAIKFERAFYSIRLTFVIFMV